jgi:EAL domain-containing protein (putative c-di-GMP-specific phosphodiesterase class I)
MYQAKNAGRNTIRFFNPATHAAMEARMAIEADLRMALPRKELVLYYQVQVDQDYRALGAEALLRWQQPERGLVPPLKFIPLAEETGQILSIGQWGLEAAGTQLQAWESDPRFRHLQLAVNVSARQFRQADFVAQVRRMLELTAFSPERLKIELTESLVLDSIDDTIDKMQALKALGVRFSLDDFGTGYSSLAYLKRLPLDQIKIDQSFVRDITTDANDAAIVKTIIAMADNLGLEVIAEGVETEAQREFLRRNGCHAYQGYLFGKPVPLDEFEAVVIRS